MGGNLVVRVAICLFFIPTQISRDTHTHTQVLIQKDGGASQRLWEESFGLLAATLVLLPQVSL